MATHHTKRIRHYETLKRQQKIANIIGIGAWLGMVQFLVISEIYFHSVSALSGGVSHGRYYIEKGSARFAVSESQFWFHRIDGIIFISSFFVCTAASVIVKKTSREIEKATPKLG